MGLPEQTTSAQAIGNPPSSSVGEDLGARGWGCPWLSPPVHPSLRSPSPVPLCPGCSAVRLPALAGLLLRRGFLLSKTSVEAAANPADPCLLLSPVVPGRGFPCLPPQRLSWWRGDLRFAGRCQPAGWVAASSSPKAARLCWQGTVLFSRTLLPARAGFCAVQTFPALP